MMLSPFFPTVITFAGESRARKSTMKSFPFSVPAYTDAPSGEKERDVKGHFKGMVRNGLY
jgi:hypothetical protein